MITPYDPAIKVGRVLIALLAAKTSASSGVFDYKSYSLLRAGHGFMVRYNKGS